MSSSNVGTVEIALRFDVKDLGDQWTEPLFRVKNLKIWDAKMNITLAASHNM